MVTESSSGTPESAGFLMVIVSSPSGAGKSTLCSMLREEFPALRFSVSHTTRTPRPNESDGREYHFVKRATFEHMVAQGAFAEWAWVHGHLYGTSLAEIDEARNNGAEILFDIDYQGARQIKAHIPGAVSIFILPPSLAELERRLRGRGTEDEETTLRRLHNAQGELEHYDFFDYVVVNNDLDTAYAQLKSITLAERCKRERLALRCEQLLAQIKGSAK